MSIKENSLWLTRSITRPRRETTLTVSFLSEAARKTREISSTTRMKTPPVTQLFHRPVSRRNPDGFKKRIESERRLSLIAEITQLYLRLGQLRLEGVNPLLRYRGTSHNQIFKLAHLLEMNKPSIGNQGRPKMKEPKLG